MSRLFGLSLLLGYAVGVAIAIALLPGPVVAPYYGSLALGGLALVGGGAALGAVVVRRARARFARATADEAPQEAPGAGEPATSGADHGHAGAVAGGFEREVVTEEVLLQILTDGRVDVLALPVAPLSDDGFAYVEAVPRLRTALGRHLEPAEYRALAARWGLTASLDRLLLERCAALIGTAMAQGQDGRVLCSIAATSLGDPDLIAMLRALIDDRELAWRLIVTVDRARLCRPARAELAELVEGGLNLCLRRLTVEAIDPGGLARDRFSFVKLDAPRHALDPAESEPAPPLRKLKQRFARSTITVLVDLRAEPVLVESADDGAFTISRAGAEAPEATAV